MDAIKDYFDGYTEFFIGWFQEHTPAAIMIGAVLAALSLVVVLAAKNSGQKLQGGVYLASSVLHIVMCATGSFEAYRTVSIWLMIVSAVTVTITILVGLCVLAYALIKDAARTSVK